MRDEFYPIYQELYQRYSQGEPVQDRRLARLAVSIIEDTSGELELTEQLRPDALLLLLVNLDQLILLPLTHPRSNVSIEQLESDLRNDVRLVLTAAWEENRGEEISSNDVLRAMQSVWGELKSLEANVWDRRI